MTEQRPRVVFCTTSLSVIAVVRDRIGETDEAAIARLTPEYGTTLTVMPAEDAQKLYENTFRKPVEEISADDFDYALNCLPPIAWFHARGGQSFKMSERIAGCITAIFVEIHGRHFRFHDDIRTPHEECLRRVADFMREAANPSQEGAR